MKQLLAIIAFFCIYPCRGAFLQNPDLITASKLLQVEQGILFSDGTLQTTAVSRFEPGSEAEVLNMIPVSAEIGDIVTGRFGIAGKFKGICEFIPVVGRKFDDSSVGGTFPDNLLCRYSFELGNGEWMIGNGVAATYVDEHRLLCPIYDTTGCFPLFMPFPSTNVEIQISLNGGRVWTEIHTPSTTLMVTRPASAADIELINEPLIPDDFPYVQFQWQLTDTRYSVFGSSIECMFNVVDFGPLSSNAAILLSNTTFACPMPALDFRGSYWYTDVEISVDAFGYTKLVTDIRKNYIEIHLDASYGVTTVEQWVDRKGTILASTNVNVSFCTPPTFVADGVHGRPFIHFGSGGAMECLWVGAGIGDPHTIAYVVGFENITVDSVIWSDIADYTRQHRESVCSGGTVQTGCIRSFSQASTSYIEWDLHFPADNSSHIVVCSFDGANANSYMCLFDGMDVVMMDYEFTGSTAVNAFVLGAYAKGSTYRGGVHMILTVSKPLVGHIAEFAVFSLADTSLRNSLSEYLNRKYNVY